MQKNIFLSLFMFFIVTTITPICASNKFFSKKIVIVGLIGTATIIMVGKLLYEAYFDYFWPDNDMITYSNQLFKKATTQLEQHKTCHENDAQLSDWDLKERIGGNYLASYPVLYYHTQLSQALYELNTAINDVKKSVTRIRYKINCLKKTTSPDHESTLKTCIALEIEGSRLQQHLQKTIALLTTLKNRIALFPEYDHDYYSFQKEQENESKKRENVYASQEKKQHEKISHTHDVFDRIEQQIIQFNLDYY